MNKENNKVIITTFTDPMMGLSYECEPVYRKLETHFPENIEFKYAMGALVRNVYYLVDQKDLVQGKDIAIKNYNKRLAKIYESEESISGMPINMTNFHLFSTEDISSIPLNIAYKAAHLTDIEKADLFLYNLRYAIIVECRPALRLEEILKVVCKTGIDSDEFLIHYKDGTAEKALNSDFKLEHELEIRTLPAYLIQYQGKSVLIQTLIGYEDFVSVIGEITDGEVKPQKVSPSIEGLRKLLNAHQLISPIEIREAFNFGNIDEVREFIDPLLENNEISIRDVYHGWFVTKFEKEMS
ncbi:DsbA family protein [Clostridium estertheticum]|uniref:DsbA family protein n=1 Tax=Clostridium estertheticum TaxID=238834 RepID=UPI001C0B3060|nr:DsbA family protein [Clostridium estertheticum]MBU3199225.1 DsbA family protein [Clostridium estertheticum]WAG67524.1 DsbA family protein [Clostridium estertheticum]